MGSVWPYKNVTGGRASPKSPNPASLRPPYLGYDRFRWQACKINQRQRSYFCCYRHLGFGLGFYFGNVGERRSSTLHANGFSLFVHTTRYCILFTIISLPWVRSTTNYSNIPLTPAQNRLQRAPIPANQ